MVAYLNLQRTPVLETYIREVTTLVHLTVNGEEIVTTVDHPFYVKNQGFIKAGELIVGDELLDVNGNVLLVENFDVELTEEPTTVYNFQVEDFHTYHVCALGVLVHNANDYASPKTRNTSELDIDKIRETKYDGTIKTGGRSGGSRPTEGKPNTYVNTDGGHKLVYGADGKLNLDISPKRVKARVYDVAPNGNLYPRDMKLSGPVPSELLESW